MFGKWAYRFLLDPIREIKKMIEKNPSKFIWVLSSILGFVFLLGFFQGLALGRFISFWQIVIMIVVLAPFVGYILVNVISWIIAGTGLWIGTRGKFKNIRCAFFCSLLPMIGYLLCKVFLLFVFGQKFFLNFPEKLSLFQAFVFYAVVIFQVFFTLWSLFLLVATLKAVKHTSMKKALFNLLLAGVVCFVIAFIVTLPFKVSCSSFFDFPELTYSSSYDGWEDSIF